MLLAIITGAEPIAAGEKRGIEAPFNDFPREAAAMTHWPMRKIDYHVN
jgi:hypothetical protein